MKWVWRGLLWLLVVGISALLFTPYCHVLFRCGCEGIWAAGSRFCNVHTAGVPHCPWCSTGTWGANLPRALVWLAQAIVVFIPTKLSWPSRLLLGLLAFVVVGAAAGLAFGLWTHYPTFLAIR